MLFFHSPFPSHKPPWKIMHHPSVLETTTALLVAAPVKHAQLALLYAILAISSFHIDWCTVSNQKFQSQSQSRNSFDQTNNTRSYWWNIGEQFERDAKLQLQLALKNEFTGPAKAKYKHILMALLCMVTICASTGRMDDARCFLLDAERVIRLRGLLKPQPSKKVRLLHNIFLYNRIIEESTFCYPAMGRSELSSAIEPNTQPFLPANDVVDPALLSHGREGGGNSSVHDRSAAGADLSLSERLIANDGAWFETIYGIPMTLMHLISQTTSLVHEADNQHSISPSADLHFMASFTRRAHTLEDLVCGFRWEPTQVGHGEGHILAEPAAQFQTAYPVGDTSAYSNVMRHLVSAMHQGLLIFFYRRIRNLNSYALQPFVKRTISDLCAFQSAKDKNDIVTPVICWPGFIAGTEALEEEDRQQFRQWFRQSGRGWRNFDTIGEMVENLWKAKEQSGSRASEVTWEHFSRKYQTSIIAT
ncbi:fungal-specific transcription factor domain-containing protein [Bisporella sp. PMI_857]|nr:fungal-specific transcription factor domain-containing protein [Bisporella sp. PMI_857]